MNAQDVIDSYVRDVAVCLPHRKRGDVAFELRALLDDELAAKARAERRATDEAMAMDLLKGFGRPAEAALRYHQRPALIDRADTPKFIVWAIFGAISVTILKTLNPPGKVDSAALFLQWLGLMVIFFAIMAWRRRRRGPGVFAWKPKRDPYATHRGLSLLLGILTLIPFFMYAAPQDFTRVFFFGGVPTDGVELDAGFFQSSLRTASIIALGLQCVVYLWLAVDGRWRRWTRGFSIGVILAIAILCAWHIHLAQRGLVFTTAKANEIATPFFGMVAAWMLIGAIYELYKEWSYITPAPTLEHAQPSSI